MNDVAYLAGLVVAAVLAWAGVAKLGSVDLVAGRFRDLGLGVAAVPLALVVPPLELVVAVALVTAPWLGGPAAATLLAAFSVVLTRVLDRGEAIGCACFGGTADRPVSRLDLIRNAALIGAALLAAGSEPAAPSLPATMIVSVTVIGAVVVGALSDLRHQVGTLWIGPDDVEDRW